MNFVNKLKLWIQAIFKENSGYMELVAITRKNGETICDFHDFLNHDGTLIRVEIKDFFKNKYLLESISSETLLLIGKIYGQNTKTEKLYKMKTINLALKQIILENDKNKITVCYKEFLEDKNLINQVNPLDLIKITQNIFYLEGFNDGSKIFLEEEMPVSHKKNDEKSNIIKFSS